MFKNAKSHVKKCTEHCQKYEDPRSRTLNTEPIYIILKISLDKFYRIFFTIYNRKKERH